LQAAEIPSSARVESVLNIKNCQLEGGIALRLAALQAPNLPDDKGRPGDPLAKEAFAFTKDLLEGKNITLKTSNQPFDPKGRLVAQAYLADGTWIQEAMLRAGWAMVYPFADQSEYLPSLLEAEQQAILEGKGIWQHPYYRILSPEEARTSANRYRLVEGKVVSATLRKRSAYLNFTQDWREGFSIRIDARKLSEDQKLNWENSYTGKKIRVRGWILQRGKQTSMDVATPHNIQLLEAP
jgi:endonuclease YncB( thermonuclease family)